jgi:hypothetical protein
MDIHQDLAAIAQATDHINRSVIDQTVRFENAARLGAGLATAVSSYLSVDQKLSNKRDHGIYLEALKEAMAAYRTSESGGFLRADSE